METVIDVHHHWLPRELIDREASYLPDGYSVREEERIKHVLDPFGQRVQSIHVEPFSDLTRRLELMDAAGARRVPVDQAEGIRRSRPLRRG